MTLVNTNVTIEWRSDNEEILWRICLVKVYSLRRLSVSRGSSDDVVTRRDGWVFRVNGRGNVGRLSTATSRGVVIVTRQQIAACSAAIAWRLTANNDRRAKPTNRAPEERNRRCMGICVCVTASYGNARLDILKRQHDSDSIAN